SLVDLFWLFRLDLFLLHARLHFFALCLYVLGHRCACEFLALGIGVHQAQAMLARKLPARAVAAVRRHLRPSEVAGTTIGLFAAALAFPEQESFIFGNVQRDEPVLEHQPATILAGIGVWRG